MTWPAAHYGDQKLVEHWRRLGNHFTEPDRQMLRPKRQRRLRSHVPGLLLTAAQAAAKLNCSIKTLNSHVKAGGLKYVIIGHGIKRPRKMFTDADLNEFIANQTRKDSPCPSDAIRARRSGSTISKSEVVAFSEVQRRRRGVKPKQ